MSATPTARELIAALARRRGRLLSLAACALVGAVPTFVAGYAVARSIDDGFLAGRTGTGLAWLGLLACTAPLGAAGQRGTYLSVASLVEPVRDDLVRVVVRGALEDATAPGAVRDTGAVARLTQQVELVRETVAGLLLLTVGFAAGIVATLAGLLTLAPIVLPLVILPLVMSLGAFAASLPALQRQQQRLLLADERFAAMAADAAGGLRDVVAAGGEARVAAALDARIADEVDAGRAIARMAAARTVIVSVGGRLPILLVLLSAGWLLDRGLSAGALVGTLTYLVQGVEPAVSSVVSGVATPLSQLAVTVRRIDGAATHRRPAPTTRGWRARPGRADLALRGVTFRYRADAEPVLREVDLAVADGEHLAVVGPSGAGKSTLAALMVGMLRPQSGVVLHGGVPAGDVDVAARVLIPQEAYVFRGTLAENLLYLQPSASPRAVARAMAEVGMAGLADRLGGPGRDLQPDALSAGERQLIALARAYLSGARLVVLDEATCHLDPEAEAVAERAFAARGGTLVVIAHRISSARRAGRILVMDGDRITLGSQDELMGGSALYRDLAGHWVDAATVRPGTAATGGSPTSGEPSPIANRATVPE